MRTLPALALVLAACGRTDGSRTPANDTPSASSSLGPDQLVLRLPRDGGLVRAFSYPALDSAMWSSVQRVPAIERVLAFDSDAGVIVAVDSKGAPVRVDLRLGTVTREERPRLTRLASSDGSAIYGIAADGTVRRLTPTDNSWSFKPPFPAREVFPQPDGSLLVLGDKGNATTIWHLHPPHQVVEDTAVVPRATRAVRTQVGDRLYFAVDSGLIGVRSRDLAPVPSVRIRRPVRAIATTPSGDRIYVVADSSRELTVIDRYSEEIDARIQLPGIPVELRMDPTGRYVLARAPRADGEPGDSAWVVAVATDRVVGTVTTGWTSDLPTVAPDGSLALRRGNDVVLLDGETLRPRRTIAGGGRDRWLFVQWNGFRPRSAELDTPVDFGVESTLAADTSGAPDTLGSGNPFAGQTPVDSSGTPPPPDTSRRAPAAPQPSTPSGAAPPARQGFLVQFGAMRDFERAQELARSIDVDGARPVVVTTRLDGVAVYRVILGPYPTKAEAERIARASGKSHWIYEGTP